MNIAIIDSCPFSTQLYSQSISTTGENVDCFSDPLRFFSESYPGQYDVVISDYYFEKANLDFFLEYINKERLIIVTGNVIRKEIDCLAVLGKNSIHTKKNIISLIKMLRPSLRLVR